MLNRVRVLESVLHTLTFFGESYAVVTQYFLVSANVCCGGTIARRGIRTSAYEVCGQRDSVKKCAVSSLCLTFGLPPPHLRFKPIACLYSSPVFLVVYPVIALDSTAYRVTALGSALGNWRTHVQVLDNLRTYILTFMSN